MTQTAQEQSVVAVYDSHTVAEATVKKLQKAGLDMKRLSIVGLEHARVVLNTTGASRLTLRLSGRSPRRRAPDRNPP